MIRSDTTATQPHCEVLITHILDAPRELVFKAWTDPEQVKQWWGPHGFTNPVCELDPRPGGVMRMVMRGPEGIEHSMTGMFREFFPPERLVFVNTPLDRDGNPLLEGLATVTLSQLDDKTKLILEARAIGLDPLAARMLQGMEMGWSQSLERLTELLTCGTVTPKQQV